MTPPAAADIGALLGSFTSTAFRLEAQPAYAVTEEGEALQRFLAGTPMPPSQYPWWQEWLDMICGITATGRTVKRVRVLSEPPTDYQQWEAWGDRWHIQAGEQISYLPSHAATTIGLPLQDWWLFDDHQLVVMRFSPDGLLTGQELITDAGIVAQHRRWRDLALRHAQPAKELAA